MFRTALILSALIAAPALAVEPVATLSAQEGTVLVNQGDQFITATSGQSLKAGDRVMIMEGGTAQVTFLDGCNIALGSGSLVEVPALSTCAGGVANVQSIGPSYAQAIGARRSNRNRAAPWVFGAWTLMIGIALGEDEKMNGIPGTPGPPPVSP